MSLEVLVRRQVGVFLQVVGPLNLAIGLLLAALYAHGSVQGGLRDLPVRLRLEIPLFAIGLVLAAAGLWGAGRRLRTGEWPPVAVWTAVLVLVLGGLRVFDVVNALTSGIAQSRTGVAATAILAAFSTWNLLAGVAIIAVRRTRSSAAAGLPAGTLAMVMGAMVLLVSAAVVVSLRSGAGPATSRPHAPDRGGATPHSTGRAPVEDLDRVGSETCEQDIVAAVWGSSEPGRSWSLT